MFAFMHIPKNQLQNLIDHRKAVSMNGLQDIELHDIIEEGDFLSAEDFLRTYRKLMEDSNNSNFGLHFGCFLNIKALGFVTFIQKSTHNFEQAIKLIQDYLDESFPLVSLEVQIKSDQLLLILSSNIHDDDELSLHILDTVFAFIYREVKLLLPPEISFNAILPYKSLHEYEGLLKNDCRYGPRHSFQFNTNPIKTPINKKTSVQIEYLLPKYLQLLEESTAEPNKFSRKVKIATLSMCSPEVPTLDQVLTQFPLSKRSFQRRLAKENSSFRDIVNGIKRKLYEYLAMGEGFKVQDIAFILGYSDPSAFLHAKSNW